MASNSGSDIAQGLADTFSFKKARNSAIGKALGLGDKDTPSPAPSTPPQTAVSVDTANQSFRDAAAKAAKPAPKKTPPKYHDGIDYVPKTGPAILKKGEAVLNNEDAAKHREEKMYTHDAYKGAAGALGGSEHKPKKEVEEIRTRKAKSGGYIHKHIHTHPEAHPDEEHVSANQDEMVDHMLQHMGTPNEGEEEANEASDNPREETMEAHGE